MSKLKNRHMSLRDLESIYEWAKQNNMSFNDSKLKVLHYENHGDSTPSDVDLSERKQMEREARLKYLGILMSRTRKFEEQVEKAVNEARQMLGMHTFLNSVSVSQKQCLFCKTLVLPHREYCCMVWNSVTLRGIRRLEAVRRGC